MFVFITNLRPVRLDYYVSMRTVVLAVVAISQRGHIVLRSSL